MGQTPVAVLTGFLGSGKTTLIRSMLTAPGFSDTAILVNEFGEVGIDHLLYDKIDDNVAVLPNGCVCCVVRSDLIRGLHDVLHRRDDGRISFRRIVIETSGLAEPASVLTSLARDDDLGRKLRLVGLTTVVDATRGARILSDFGEAVAQVACADRLLVSKCDLQPEIGKLEIALRDWNDYATIQRTSEIDVAQVLFSELRPPSRLYPQMMALPAHTRGVGSCLVRLAVPIGALAFARALGRLATEHGYDLLRVKGLVVFEGDAAPTEIHAVQHALYPPRRLDRWPDGDRESRLLFIFRRITRDIIIEFFAAAGIAAR